MLSNIMERNKIIFDFFAKNNVEIAFMGEKERPLIVDVSTGEALNCMLTDSESVIFRFTKEHPKKKYTIPINNLNENYIFDFDYWFKNSTKKKIYIFQNEKKYFRRYNVKNNTYIPIFTNSLDWAYFVFRYEKALLFKQKMNLRGINLNIIKKWENNRIKKIC